MEARIDVPVPELGCSARGYVSEEDVARIDLGVPGRFVPEDLSQPIQDVRLERIAAVGTSVMDLVELSSHYGGGVAARAVSRLGEARIQVPVLGQFMVNGIINVGSGNVACSPVRAVRGTLHVRGRPESFAARFWRHLLKVLVRESGL